MTEDIFWWLENAWSFQDIWEGGSKVDYSTARIRIAENLNKAINEGNVDGFFMWVEDEYKLEEVWNKGIKEYNDATKGFQYMMTYHQFKTMFKNKVKEDTIMTQPELAQNLFGGSADDFKST